MKRIIITLVIIILASTGFGSWVLYGRMHAKNKQQTVPASVISVTTAKIETIPLTVNALGQIVAPKTIMLKTQTDGTVTHIYFKSGEQVKRGQLLLQLDPTAAEAAVAQAYANYFNLKTTYDRYVKLEKQDPGSVSADTLSQQQSSVTADKALWEAAKQQLSYTQIRAPFDGVIGIPEQNISQVAVTSTAISEALQLNVGSYLATGSAVAILSNPHHIFVQYQVPQNYGPLLKIGQPVTLEISALPKHKFTGEVKYISSVVYESNQAFEIIASINDPDSVIRSGMNANITQTLDPTRRILAVPGLSLVASLSGYSVYIVENSKVKEIPITIGQRFGNLIAISSGLKAGDQVISDGDLTVHPGMTVQIKS